MVYYKEFYFIDIKNTFSKGLICFFLLEHDILVCRQSLPEELLIVASLFYKELFYRHFYGHLEDVFKGFDLFLFVGTQNTTAARRAHPPSIAATNLNSPRVFNTVFSKFLDPVLRPNVS